MGAATGSVSAVEDVLLRLTAAPVVVGFDGFDPHDAALARGVHEARAAHRRLTLVHVLPFVMGDAEGAATHQRRVERVCEAALRGQVGPGAYDALPVDVVLRAGAPEDALLDQAARAALLVLGAGGRARSRRDVPGTTTQRCLQQARCPVMVVPSGTPGTPGTRRVVLAVAPGSQGAEAADWAREEAVRLGCDLTVFTARPVGSTQQHAAQELQHGVVASLRELLQPEDMLVLADHGRAGDYPFRPSVGAAVLAVARCPVVFVPSAR